MAYRTPTRRVAQVLKLSRDSIRFTLDESRRLVPVFRPELAKGPVLTLADAVERTGKTEEFLAREWALAADARLGPYFTTDDRWGVLPTLCAFQPSGRPNLTLAEAAQLTGNTPSALQATWDAVFGRIVAEAEAEAKAGPAPMPAFPAVVDKRPAQSPQAERQEAEAIIVEDATAESEAGLLAFLAALEKTLPLRARELLNAWPVHFQEEEAVAVIVTQAVDHMHALSAELAVLLNDHATGAAGGRR
jgi:hypothetical protein